MATEVEPTTVGEVRFFGVLRESPALHFHLFQAVAFSYLMFRFLSRDYTVYGHMTPEMFDYPFSFRLELWPVPVLHWTSFQFIYAVIPRPGPAGIAAMQWVVSGACLLGLLGVRPRWCAWLAFAVAVHVTGMMQASNSPLDGGTLALCAVLILGLSPARSFYRLGGGDRPARSVDYHWPLFCLLLTVSFFYTRAGIAKIVDVGPHWPFLLHLDRFATQRLEESIFLTTRYVHPAVAASSTSYALSVLGGFVTLLGEALFFLVLWLPRHRLFFVGSMIVLHVLVFLLMGINFVGSSVILLLCFDWNALARRLVVSYDPASTRVAKWVARLRRWDRFARLDFVPEPGARTLVARDETGERYEGLAALEQAWARVPLGYPLAVALKLPGVVQLIRLAARRRSARTES